MAPRVFQAELWVPRSIGETFSFFADAGNLRVLTPDWVGFTMLTALPIELRAGAMIDYRLRLHGIPVRWQTEITAWEPPHRFVDCQRRGPYRLWIHEHRFVESRDGTMIVDEVRYAPPGGWLTDRLFVRRDLERIFAFRSKRLQELLGRQA